MRKKFRLKNEKNNKRTLCGLSESSRQLLQVSYLDLTKAEKTSKQKKNTIYVQEYKKAIAKMEAEILTKKNKMREKLKRIELMSACEDNNTATMTHKNKADRSEYDNTLKAFENIQVLLNRHSNEKF